MTDCNRDCENCEHCEVDIDIRGVNSSVICNVTGEEVGSVVDDYDYEENPIQRVNYWY